MESLEATRRQRALIDALVAEPARLGPDLQPVRRLDDRSLVGVKATGRGQLGTELATTTALLAGAQANGLVERLDWAFRVHTFDVVLAGAPQLAVWLVPEPETFGSLCPPRLAAPFARARRELTVYAEITPDGFADTAALRRAVAEWREWGWRVSLGDCGDNTAAWELGLRLRPDVVQVHLQQPGRRPDTVPAPVRAVLGDAVAAGRPVLALGVDSAADAADALALGAVWGRGALLGAPGPLSALV